MSQEVRLTDPNTGAQKGQKPQRFALLPWSSLASISEVYHFGAKKYKEHNWRGGYPWSWSYDALQRHLSAWWEGEDRDPESGLSHLAHAGFHVLSLLYYQRMAKGTDDRYKEPDASVTTTERGPQAAQADVHRRTDAGIPEVQLRGVLRRREEPLLFGLGVPQPSADGHGAAPDSDGPGQSAPRTDVVVREARHRHVGVSGPDGFHD